MRPAPARLPPTSALYEVASDSLSDPSQAPSIFMAQNLCLSPGSATKIEKVLLNAGNVAVARILSEACIKSWVQYLVPHKPGVAGPLESVVRRIQIQSHPRLYNVKPKPEPHCY